MVGFAPYTFPYCYQCVYKKWVYLPETICRYCLGTQKAVMLFSEVGIYENI